MDDKTVTIDQWATGQTAANQTGRVHVLVGTEKNKRVEVLDEVVFVTGISQGTRVARPTIWRIFFPRVKHGK